KTWLLIKHKDRFTSQDDVTQNNRSVLSGVAVDDLKVVPVHRIPAALLVPAGEAEAMPEKLAPMLAEVADSPFNKADWMWEPKLDGYRVLAFIDEHGVKLRSRRGLGSQAGSDGDLSGRAARRPHSRRLSLQPGAAVRKAPEAAGSHPAHVAISPADYTTSQSE
ncbi:MAG: hypothetical protein ACREVR_01800, partial [Burkholderiales bacterium]